jgi:hypothetical protein
MKGRIEALDHDARGDYDTKDVAGVMQCFID